ncbi:hypothetical protein DMA15_27130 [Streptomyces sp. WAC 01529]|uniref:hypothetical protein n=1 Tax=Streptomyces sp. WAC 01529 TaxID=2203205 RepID=UPI000F6C3FF4|nr:hypothetical protein [Streptomyces sp. WAC 01529]AZM55805.1 hypothetical protein DMA15_27130 [Streptomyces sp. WAC 01529]
MTTEPTPPRTITLDGQHAASLARLLRELERFFDNCDEATADAMADFFDLHPAAEAYSAAICLHADTLESALGTADQDVAEPSVTHLRPLHRSGPATS